MHVLALDTETTISTHADPIPDLVCWSWALGDRSGVEHWTAGDGHLRDLIRNCVIVGSNVAFDSAVFCKAFPDILPEIFRAYDDQRIVDIAIREKLIRIAQGRQIPRNWDPLPGLAELAQIRLGREISKGDDTWRKRYGELRDVQIAQWPADAIAYARTDAEVTLAIYGRQQDRRGDLIRDAAHQTRSHFALHLASSWGFATDPAKVRALEEDLTLRREALAVTLEAYGLLRRGRGGTWHRDQKRAQGLIAEVLGARAPRTDKGAIRLDVDACRESGHHALEAYSEFASIVKQLGDGWGKGNIAELRAGGSYVVRTVFDPLKDTGRTGSRKPNVQNVPRDGGIRECYSARPGCVLACADYGGLELHTFAIASKHLVGFSDMMEALNRGEDVHLSLAANAIGISYGEALRDRKTDRIKSARQRAKAGNFGFPGGMGAPRFIETQFRQSKGRVQFTESEANQLRNEWFAKWREARPYFDRVGRMVGANGRGTVEHLFTRRLRGGVRFTEAANSFFQGLGADAAKLGLWEVCRRCYAVPGSALYGSRIVNFVHDEIILETPYDRFSHIVAEELGEAMATGANRILFECPVEAEPLLAFNWSKANETRRDSEGMITVC
jgi:DNA polymerase-1